MKVEAVHGPKFSTIVRKRGAGSALVPAPTLSFFDPEDPLTVLVGSYLLWESSPTLAADAATRMATLAVDANELRVMLEPELVEAMGPKYPFVEERAARLRSTLNDIYRRQHRTSLDHLRNAARKDQRSYLGGHCSSPSTCPPRSSTRRWWRCWSARRPCSPPRRSTRWSSGSDGTTSRTSCRR
jgi:hypothetical protein